MKSRKAPGATVVIDGRMIYQDQCHGIARVTIELNRNLPVERSADLVLILAEGAVGAAREADG